ncbi:MAG: diacylglycerol kinase family lipid kinase [Clostridia bacterium]|nr:diacylglycerol kinase family lipid kinase [Clostridia bacterium]
MFDIILNPNAGKGNALKSLEIAEKLFKENNIEYTIHRTERQGHAIEITKQLTSQGKEVKLVVLGGDGTFNEVVNGIVDFDKTIVGFVPSGTGNDYVSATSIPKNPEEALQLVIDGNVGYTDFIDMGDKRCLNVAGGGMDTDVLIKYAEMKHFHGKVKYLIALLIVLIKLKFHKLTLKIDDGETMERTVFMIGIGNGKYIGGGMPISPESVVDDGVMNVVVINQIKRIKLIPYLIKFLKGKDLSLPITEHYKCTHARLEILDEGKVQADGEIMDRKVIDCTLKHEILKIYKKKNG